MALCVPQLSELTEDGRLGATCRGVEAGGDRRGVDKEVWEQTFVGTEHYRRSAERGE